MRGDVCVRVQDMLHIGVPVVTRVGELWRNRIGAAILQRAGFPVRCLVLERCMCVFILCDRVILDRPEPRRALGDGVHRHRGVAGSKPQ
jgi:hypothetical protein